MRAKFIMASKRIEKYHKELGHTFVNIALFKCFEGAPKDIKCILSMPCIDEYPDEDLSLHYMCDQRLLLFRYFKKRITKKQLAQGVLTIRAYKQKIHPVIGIIFDIPLEECKGDPSYFQYEKYNDDNYVCTFDGNFDSVNPLFLNMNMTMVPLIMDTIDKDAKFAYNCKIKLKCYYNN